MNTYEQGGTVVDGVIVLSFVHHSFFLARRAEACARRRVALSYVQYETRNHRSKAKCQVRETILASSLEI